MNTLTFNELTGCNTYPCYGGGGILSTPWPPFTISGYDVLKASGERVFTIEKMYPFKLQRFFIDNFIFNEGPPVTLQTEPTPGNFWIDTYFKLCKANGIKTWWAPAGVFAWHKMPINPSTGKEYSRRKSMPIPPGSDPFTKEAWDEIAELQKQIGAHYNGTGLLDYLELVGNECFDFPWNTVLKGTPEMVAEGAYWCYKAVRSVNTELKLVLPSGTSWNLNRLKEVPFYLKKKFESMGEQMPADLYHTSHNYLRDNSQSQGPGTTGITPEDAKMNEWSYGMDLICKEFGLLGYLVGESGYGTDNDAQHAPDIEGFDRGTSQGVCNLRFGAILGTSPYFKGVTFYHCRDLFDQGAYDYTGYSDKDWNWKKAMYITVDFKEKYGDFSPVEYSFKNEISTLKIQKGEEVKWLQWTNKQNIGNLTPMFQEVEEPTQPPMPNLQVLTKQLQWSDGQPCNLIHADSPESRLHPNYKAAFSAECKLLPTFGINTITVTMRGDDVTAISPWVNNNPAQGVDTAKLQTWHDQLKEFLTECEKNNLRGVIIAYLGERTNFKSITEAQYQEWINAMTPIFEDISGSIIWGWEEIWDGSESATMIFADRIGGYLKSKLPKSLMMIHNNPGQKPWRGMSNVVQIVCIQETSVEAMKVSAQDAFSKGFVPHFHELYPGFKLSNSEATNKALMTQLCNAALSINVKNVGCFSSDYDLQSPDANKLSYLYKHQSALINGSTPNPNPTNMLKYSLSPNPFPNALPLNGATIPSGAKIYIFWDGVGKTPLKFQPSGQLENGAPYEYKGGQPVIFADGNHTVTVHDGNNVLLQTASFTVGQTTPPPPTEVKGTTFVKTGGKIEFSFEDGSKLTVSPD